MDGTGYMSFIIAKLSVHTNVRFGLMFQRNMTLSRCHPHHPHFSCLENVVCRAQRVQLDSGWQPRAKVHKRSVHVPSRESAQTTQNHKPHDVQDNATMETRQDYRIAKRKLNSMKKSRTSTHSAMSEVMTTHSKTEVDHL